MYKRILVPLDGSRRAECAVLAAARLARASHGTVILMQSVTPTSANGVSDSAQARDRALSYLTSLTEIPQLSGIPTLTCVTEGPAAEHILDTTRTEQVDLMALCARGMSGFHRWKLGSVSHHVTRHAECPVLLLPDPAPGAIPSGLVDQLATVSRALVPLDGSLFAEVAISTALELIAALAPDAGELQLFQVASPYTTENQRNSEEGLVDQASVYLAQIAERLRVTHLEHLRFTVTTAVAIDTDSATRILDIAEPPLDVASEGDGAPSPMRGCDIIVMATHGRSGILRWTLGSVTERVMQATRLPMLVVRPFVNDAT
jgi:nucleotide-binding universal stress UspA family protein